MDDRYQAAGTQGLPVQGPHWRHPSSHEPPADFVALRLMLQAGGYTFELTRPEVLAGRHTEADIRLPLPDVSRRHCRFTFARGAWQVCDLNSLNGVFVNGERVHEACLRQGDTVRIGGFTFVVELADGGLSSSSPTADEGQIAGSVLRSIADALPSGTQESPHVKRRAG